MKEYKTSDLIYLAVNSDLHTEYKVELLEILRALNVIQPWEVTELRDIINLKREN